MKFSFLRTVPDLRLPVTAAFLALALSACASGTGDTLPANGPRDTGRYPNINIEGRAATAQMTDAERESIVRDLGARQIEDGE